MPMPSKYQKYYDGLKDASISGKATNVLSLGSSNSSTVSRLSNSISSGTWTELGVTGLKETVGVTVEDASILNNNFSKLSDACSKAEALKGVLDNLKAAYDKYDNLSESDFYTTDSTTGERHFDSAKYNAKKQELKENCEKIEKEADSKISEINGLTVSDLKDLSLAIAEAAKQMASSLSLNLTAYKNPQGLSGSHLDFINMVADGAVQAYKKYGVLPSLTLAQAILETGWGKSTIGYNIFGIKAGSSWTGKVKRVKTAEQRKNGSYYQIYANFRDYDSYAESIEDHAKLLTGERYKRVIQSKNYVDACKAVKACGYATSLNYATNLINIIKKYGLDQWDNV